MRVELVNFYSYGSIVCGGRITDYNLIGFAKCLFSILDALNVSLVDTNPVVKPGTVLARTTFTNKVAFSVVINGVRYYVGYADGRYTIGHSMFESGYQIPINKTIDYPLYNDWDVKLELMTK